jgi:hypothetical protein
MSEEKPDYAAILKNRKPLPTIDLDDLKRRSAEATKATVVLQPASEPIGEAVGEETAADPAASTKVSPAKAPTRNNQANAPNLEPVPLRFSVRPEMLRELRIQAALEDKSVPDLMRAIIAAYLRKQDRQRSA